MKPKRWNPSVTPELSGWRPMMVTLITKNEKETNMFDLKNKEKVLACKVIERPGKYISDEIVSYKTKGDAKVGDVFAAYKKYDGLVFVEVVKVYSMAEYSEERIGLGNTDTMSYAIQKVDMEKYAKEKEARIKARDIEAAARERLEKAMTLKKIEDAIKVLGKDDANELKKMFKFADDLRNNPELLDELDAE